MVLLHPILHLVPSTISTFPLSFDENLQAFSLLQITFDFAFKILVFQFFLCSLNIKLLSSALRPQLSEVYEGKD